MPESLSVPGLILIGSFERNDGKTTLACHYIKQWKSRFPVYALKVISTDRGRHHCPHGSAGCGICSSFSAEFELMEEKDYSGFKDTSKMLLAGAVQAHLLKSFSTAVPEAFAHYLEQVPKRALIVCESNTLRQHVEPGVFLFGARSRAEGRDMKPSARAVLHHVDYFVDSLDDIPALAVEEGGNGALSVSLAEAP